MAYLHRVKRTLILALSVCAATLGAAAQTEPPRDPSGHAGRITRFYPHPATTHIQFDFRLPPGAVLRLRVFNFMGRKVVDLPRVNPVMRLDLASFTRGFYIYQLLDVRGRVLESGKFQVER
jgi:hypothetical protein